MREHSRNRVTSGRDEVERENQSAEEQMEILGFVSRNNPKEMTIRHREMRIWMACLNLLWWRHYKKCHTKFNDVISFE